MKKGLIFFGILFLVGFVDGDYTYEAAMADMMSCFEFLDDNGIMIVNDYSANGHPNVFIAVNEFAARYNAPWFFLPENRVTTDYRTVIFQKRVVK